MADFEIEAKDNLGRSNRRLEQESFAEKGMLGFLIKKGIVKSENMGNYVLIGVAVFFFVMSALVYFYL